jgi:hypothetical protein
MVDRGNYSLKRKSGRKRRGEMSAYLQINRTKINVPNINVLQINGSLDQQKFVEV